ncbi:MAG: histidine kinase [Micrococcus sp.]|nr:histidine kinase [Micrococcus sp.]
MTSEPPTVEGWVRGVVVAIGVIVVAAELLLMVTADAHAWSTGTVIDSAITLLCGITLVIFLAGPVPFACASLVVAGLSAPLDTFVIHLLALPGIALLCARYLPWRLLIIVALGHATAIIAATAIRSGAAELFLFGCGGLAIGLATGGATRALSVRLRAAEDERRRIVAESRRAMARDLHDGIAHNLAIIALQAEALPLQAAEQWPVTADHLARSARETHRDLRGLLDVLYESTGFDPDESTPGAASSCGDLRLDDSLNGVAEQLRQAGFTVRLRWPGKNPASAPVSLRAAIHRIAQEAAANVMRHGQPGGDVEITAHHGSSAFELCVTNAMVPNAPPSAATPGPAPIRAGYGLTNVRERAQLLGGHASACAQDDRWVLRVSVPMTQP